MPVLKELKIAFIGEDSGYAQIIKACEAETSGKLELLDIYTKSPNQATSNQLVESLPKMKVKRLNCAQGVFTSSDLALMSALYKNTSIVSLRWIKNGETCRHVAPILQRNKLLAHIKEDFLGEARTVLPTVANDDDETTIIITTIVPTAVVAANDENIITPLGRWSRVLAEVGHQRVVLRATPVYMILQAVLAQWVEP
jgi:hypothetical protein